MDKIIGRVIVLSILLVQSVSLFAGMSLRVTDLNGMPLKQAGVSQPFALEVTLTDGSSFGTYPTIKGIEQFDVRTTGMRISTINGKTTATYTYRVQVNNPGVYVVGPAIFTSGSNTFESNTISISVDDNEVAQTQIPSSSKGKQAKTVDAFMRLTTNKPQAVEGERIGCQLRFYFTDERVMLKQLIMQEAQHMASSAIHGPITGTEKIDGTLYHYAEWSWDMYAHASGKQTIPAYGIDYEQELPRDRQMWGGFGRFFGNQVDRKRIYSNAVTMQIDPLPVHDGIQGIGLFSYFHMSAQPSSAREGEGIVVTLELAGDANMHEIVISSLQNIPQELKSYESKQYIVDARDQEEESKKRFEFVVQGLKSGSWEIPAQKFTYYDVKSKKVKTMSTAPLALMIMPGAAKQGISFDPDESDKNMVIAPLHSEGPWHPSAKGWRFSWFILIGLVCAPLGGLIVRGMILHGRSRVKVPYELIREKYAFSHAKKQFAKLKSEKNVQRLYALFVELMANKCKTSLAAITVPFIILRLQKSEMGEDKIEEWNQFFKQITERAYSATSGDKDEQLFKQAEQWLDDLQKVL